MTAKTQDDMPQQPQAVQAQPQTRAPGDNDISSGEPREPQLNNNVVLYNHTMQNNPRVVRRFQAIEYRRQVYMVDRGPLPLIGMEQMMGYEPNDHVILPPRCKCGEIMTCTCDHPWPPKLIKVKKLKNEKNEKNERKQKNEKKQKIRGQRPEEYNWSCGVFHCVVA